MKSRSVLLFLKKRGNSFSLVEREYEGETPFSFLSGRRVDKSDIPPVRFVTPPGEFVRGYVRFVTPPLSDLSYPSVTGARLILNRVGRLCDLPHGIILPAFFRLCRQRRTVRCEIAQTMLKVLTVGQDSPFSLA